MSDRTESLTQALARLLIGLEVIATQDATDLVLDPHRSVRMADALLKGEDIRDWRRA